MFIVHIVHSYYPVVGGIERVVQKIAECQFQQGHEVHVLTSRFGAESKPAEEKLKGVHVHRIRTWRLNYPDLTVPREFCEDLLRKADLIHLHSQNSLFNIILGKRAKKIGKPLVVDFLALDYLKFHANFLIRFLGNYYQEKVQREATKLADRAITLNERDHQILKKKYGIESEIIPHGVDDEYLTKPKNDQVFRRNYEVYSENIITYIGRLHPSKGPKVLIKSTPLIAREVNDFMVVIAGEDSESYKKKLIRLTERQGVKHKVRFLGYIHEDEKISLLDSSKVFVFPTQHYGEAYPLVIDEAYARGVPVIATRVGALPYRIKHMETGLLVPPNDPPMLAKAVTTLLKDDNLLMLIRRIIQNVNKSLLRWKEVSDKLDRVYEMCVSDVNRRQPNLQL